MKFSSEPAVWWKPGKMDLWKAALELQVEKSAFGCVCFSSVLKIDTT